MYQVGFAAHLAPGDPPQWFPKAYYNSQDIQLALDTLMLRTWVGPAVHSACAAAAAQLLLQVVEVRHAARQGLLARLACLDCQQALKQEASSLQERTAQASARPRTNRKAQRWKRPGLNQLPTCNARAIRAAICTSKIGL